MHLFFLNFFCGSMHLEPPLTRQSIRGPRTTVVSQHPVGGSTTVPFPLSLSSPSHTCMHLLPACSSCTGRTCCLATATCWRRTSAWAPSLCASAASTRPPTQSTLSRWLSHAHNVNSPDVCETSAYIDLCVHIDSQIFFHQ